MSTHLTDAELHAFAEGRLRSDDLIRADDHLARCLECRARGAGLTDFARASTAVQWRLTSAGGHLSDEDIHLAALGSLEPPRRAEVRRHLQECETCSQQVSDLRSWSAQSPSRLKPLAIAAAILLAALIPAMLWQARTPRPKENASLAGLAQLSASDQARVRASLDAGVGRLPDFMTGLTGSRETLMSGTPSRVVDFAPVSPLATATLSDRPTFSWRPLAGADSYVVTVFDEQSNEITRSSPLAQPTWVPDRPLPRERTYVWQVAALRNGQTVVTPVAPMPPAKFHVVDAHTADVVERAHAEWPDSHVLLGILDMNAGIVDDAIRQFEQVGPTQQGADLARRSLDRLRLVHGS
jgi:hypothetical protein